MDIPDSYFEQKFMSLVGYPTKSTNGNMIGGCPFCMEGKSWGVKKRFQYYADKKFCICFNCGESYSQMNFLRAAEGVSYAEIARAVIEEGGSVEGWKSHTPVVNLKPPDLKLPINSINLMDEQQVSFYSDDFYVKNALKIIRERRLDTAKNGCDLYLSREDMVHKNRIIIPFYDENHKLVYYQSRAQTKGQEKSMPKYLTSLGGKKNFFGMDKFSYNKPYAFVLEGPIDSMFVDNSLGCAGLSLNTKQKNDIECMAGFVDVVFCYDNDFHNPDVVKKYQASINEGYMVFMWGGSFEEYKDFNDYAIDHKLDEIPVNDILEYSYSGSEARKILTEKQGIVKPSKEENVFMVDV